MRGVVVVISAKSCLEFFYMIVELLRPFPSPDIIVRDAGLEPVFEELLKIYNFHLHQKGTGLQDRQCISPGGGGHIRR